MELEEGGYEVGVEGRAVSAVTVPLLLLLVLLLVPPPPPPPLLLLACPRHGRTKFCACNKCRPWSIVSSRSARSWRWAWGSGLSRGLTDYHCCIPFEWFKDRLFGGHIECWSFYCYLFSFFLGVQGLYATRTPVKAQLSGAIF